MRVLTEQEFMMLRGRGGGSGAVLRVAEKKLEKFQQKKTDPDYVQAIDALIPKAEIIADDQMRLARRENKPLSYDRAFYRAVNVLARDAGLRNLQQGKRKKYHGQ